jgi:hypothetical protein
VFNLTAPPVAYIICFAAEVITQTCTEQKQVHKIVVSPIIMKIKCARADRYKTSPIDSTEFYGRQSIDLSIEDEGPRPEKNSPSIHRLFEMDANHH